MKTLAIICLLITALLQVFNVSTMAPKTKEQKAVIFFAALLVFSLTGIPLVYLLML